MIIPLTSIILIVLGAFGAAFLVAALHHNRRIAALEEELAQARADNTALRTLYEDVERWRESGDVRDLRYMIETMDELDKASLATKERYHDQQRAGSAPAPHGTSEELR